MKIAEIDMDYLAEADEVSRKVCWTHGALENWDGFGSNPKLEELDGKVKRFRLYDDDNELYYEGWLFDDDEAIVQTIVLDWGKHDSGCTTIKLWQNGKWEQIIG